MARRPSSFFLDTNVYIHLLRDPDYERRLERFFRGTHLFTVNKIVLMELWEGVKTKAEAEFLEEQERHFPACGFLDEGFVVAGKILLEMTRNRQPQSGNRRKITWDILIAVSAYQNDAIVVTKNTSDFRRIQKYLGFQFAPADKD